MQVFYAKNKTTLKNVYPPNLILLRSSLSRYFILVKTFPLQCCQFNVNSAKIILKIKFFLTTLLQDFSKRLLVRKNNFEK